MATYSRLCSVSVSCLDESCLPDFLPGLLVRMHHLVPGVSGGLCMQLCAALQQWEHYTLSAAAEVQV